MTGTSIEKLLRASTPNLTTNLKLENKMLSKGSTSSVKSKTFPSQTRRDFITLTLYMAQCILFHGSLLPQ